MPALILVFASRAACIAVCVFAFFATIVLTCGANTFAMFAVLGIDGLSGLLWIACACALGSVVLDRFRIRTNLLLMIASAGGLGLGIFSLLGLFAGLAGALNRPVAMSLPIASVIFWLVSLLHRPGAFKQRIDLSPFRAWLMEPAGFAWVWIIPVISLAMVCVSASILPGVLWKPFDPAPYDVTSYHLQVPREWYEGGRIVPLHHNVFSYFPFNVEMQFLLLMYVMGGPWAGMYASQFVSTGYYVLMVLGIAGACLGDSGERRTRNVELRTSNVQRRTSRSPDLLEYESRTGKGDASVRSPALDVQRSAFTLSPAIGAAFAAVVPWAMMLSGVAYVESALMLYTALAIAWAMKSISSSASNEPSGSAAGPSWDPTDFAPFLKPMMLAGIMAGFAAGVKFTAIPMLLLPVPAAVLLVSIVRRSPKLPMRQLLLGCAGCVIAGSLVVSPWLVRNLVWTGNPVWPLAMNTLGRDHFSPEQVERFTTAHSPRADQLSATARVSVLWRDVLDHWQYGYILFPAGLLALAIRWNDRQTWLLLLAGLSIFVVWIGFTHLLSRFLVMLIPLAGIAIGRVRWRSLWPVGIVMVLIAAGVSWSNFVPELMKQSAVPPNNALFGPADLTGFLSKEILEARDKKMQIGLIGDAQSFLYQIPMSQLHYSSVFDLPANLTDPVEAWAGKEAVGNPDYWLVVNTSEINRLHQTYFRVPPLPGKWRSQFPQTFFVRSDAAAK